MEVPRLRAPNSHQTPPSLDAALRRLQEACDTSGSNFATARRLAEKLSAGEVTGLEALAIVATLLEKPTTVQQPPRTEFIAVRDKEMMTAMRGLKARLTFADKREQKLAAALKAERATLRSEKARSTIAISAANRLAKENQKLHRVIDQLGEAADIGRSVARDARKHSARSIPSEPDPIAVTEKACTQCGETKSQSEFYRQRRSVDGLMSECKMCHRARQNRIRVRTLAKI